VPNSSRSTRTWIITGPTSGIGRRTALKLAEHGSVVLVGRDPDMLAEVEAEINARPQGHAVSVVCDFSDIPSVRRAAARIVALGLPIAGLLNNAGIMPTRADRTAQGWDLAFTTNHLGPFALTEALIPHLPDGANVVFVCSAVEDPERKPRTPRQVLEHPEACRPSDHRGTDRRVGSDRGVLRRERQADGRLRSSP
jgi:NAD(P)-dependent dehydrogenase (short-subunit alcohol dehydrogenase family)